jgi:preprotein translocase subunit SecE
MSTYLEAGRGRQARSLDEFKEAAMARKPGSGPQAMRSRAAKTAAAMASSSAVAQSQPKKKTSPAQFAREVRAETRKITWPSRRETWITSVMVMIMVALTALFFAVVDVGVQFGVTQILKLANPG